MKLNEETSKFRRNEKNDKTTIACLRKIIMNVTIIVIVVVTCEEKNKIKQFFARPCLKNAPQ